MTDPSPLTYHDAGVDIDEGARLVQLIAPAAAATARAGSTAGLGGFAAAFDLRAAGYRDPILLATTDGVGTKLKIAIETGEHGGIGIDLVAMCVNDLLAQGGEPLMFLDYYATARLDAEAAATVVRGIAQGCRIAGCALAGGETAEMPGLYRPGDYDLAGFALGAAERGGLLPRQEAITPGCALIGVASSGAHANGFSLIRKIVDRTGLRWDAPAPFAPDRPLGAALLEPTRIYVQSMLPLIREGLILGLAHITGGGLIENPPRMLSDGQTTQIDWNAWPRPALFRWLQEAGATPEADLRRTFNLGVGMVAAVRPDDVDAVLARFTAAGETAFVIGAVA